MKKKLKMKALMLFLKGFVLLFVVTLLLACTSDNDNPNPGLETDQDPEPKPPIVEGDRGNKEVSEALQNGSTWKTECFPSGTGNRTVTWSFTLTDFSTKYNVYSDSACTNKDSDRSSDFSGTYEVGSDQITSPGGYKAYELDITFSGGGSLESLVALSEDGEKILIATDEARPTDFSSAFEFSKEGGEGSENTQKDRGIDQNHEIYLANLDCLREIDSSWGSEPPSFANLRALSRSIKAFRLSRNNKVFS